MLLLLATLFVDCAAVIIGRDGDLRRFLRLLVNLTVALGGCLRQTIF